MSVLSQDHYKYDEFPVLETVIMGNERLHTIMKEKDALYAKPDFSDEDGIKAAELEGEFAELNGWEAESEASSLLQGLGIGTDAHYKLMSELTGAEKVKVLLAQALFGNPGILILDEPTNHLDIKSIKWLQNFLGDFEGTVIVVSHDRHFLNEVCTHMADVDFGKIKLYVGNYDFWYESSQLATQMAKDQNKKKEEKIKAMIAVKKDSGSANYVFATKNGLVKKTATSEFTNIMKKGKIAIVLNENDELIGVKETTGDDEILIAASNGKVARFHESDIRPMGRKSIGVKGMNVDGGYVVGLATSKEGSHILSVTEKGYGKKTPIAYYRMSKRGAKGVLTINVSEATGNLICIHTVNGDEDAMIVTNEGIIIRLSLENVASYGRNTKGVRLINLSDSDAVVSKVTIVEKEEAEEITETEENAENIVENTAEIIDNDNEA